MIAGFAILVGIAAICDLRARRVPNWLVAIIAITGLVAGGSPLGILVGMAMLLPAFAARWLGGGDVKLLAAMGAWLGPVAVVWTGMLGLGLGGGMAVVMMIAGGVSREVMGSLRASAMTMTAPVAPRRRQALVVPLAVPLAIAGIVVKAGWL